MLISYNISTLLLTLQLLLISTILFSNKAIGVLVKCSYERKYSTQIFRHKCNYFKEIKPKDKTSNNP